MTKVAKPLSPDATQALADAAKRELAQRHLLEYCTRMDSKFQSPPHIRKIAELFEDIEAGRKRRVIVTLAPRHGKSRLAQLFGGWYLGRSPAKNIIGASHSAELAEKNSRAVRAQLEDDRFPFAVRLSKDSSAVHRWAVVPEGGGFYAAGVGGSITGRGADLLLLDDAEHDEGSDLQRDTTWRWYTEVAVPRLEPGAATIVIATRWAIDDLVGRLLDAPDGDEWSVLTLPAIAGEEDALGRAPGDALWPGRFSREELLKQRVSMGARAFDSQFNQDPCPRSGAIFLSEWLSKKFTTPPDLTTTAIAVDSSWGKNVRSDFSVLAAGGTDGVDFFITDVERGRWTYPELKERVIHFHARHKSDAIVVEDASSGTAVVQELQTMTRLPVIPVVAKGSKESRAESVSPLFEAGKVYLPADAPWLDDFLQEMLRFPGGKNDDQVDAVVLLLTRLRDSTNSVPFGMTVNRGIGNAFFGGW
jgi:predicted phage terminase large subunit-like protein